LRQPLWLPMLLNEHRKEKAQLTKNPPDSLQRAPYNVRHVSRLEGLTMRDSSVSRNSRISRSANQHHGKCSIGPAEAGLGAGLIELVNL
jgi:hypothetical protein